MRVGAAGAVLMVTAALSLGAMSSANATVGAGPEPEQAVGFTPPIGTNHGSVLARDLAKRPNGFEMDIGWITLR